MMKQYHFIGIGGVGMSGLARILLQRGATVSGSDLAPNYVTQDLIEAGAQVFIGHSAKYISQEKAIVYNTEIQKDNPELLEALKLNCPVLHRSDLLRELMNGYQTLAVAGTHGKTTTTALLTCVLKEAGLDPSFAIGGVVPQLGTNAHESREGRYFVAEADESDGTFQKYQPFGAIITNIDFDHMNFYLHEKALLDAFLDFAKKVKQGPLIWCGDDFLLQRLNLSGISYGFSENCQLHISDCIQKEWCLNFTLQFNGTEYRDIFLPLVGRHNVLNGAAVFGMALSLGIEEAAIREAFKKFKGIKRRCELKAQAHQILVLDDYAHHPTEIETTLNGIRKAIGERRLIAIFQPHRYTRTKDCLGSYGKIFNAADLVLVTEIYASNEQPIEGVNHSKIIAEIKNNSLVVPKHIPRKNIIEELLKILKPFDVVVTLGAGDITQVGNDLAKKLEEHPPKPWKIGLVYGGRSVEHEVSLSSAHTIAQGLDQPIYEFNKFLISKNGTWHKQTNIQPIDLATTDSASTLNPEILQDLLECDIFFPILHGTYGEDGTLQGLFEMLNKAYVGCDHRSAAISMDKVLTKKLAEFAGIPITPYVDIPEMEWKVDSQKYLSKIKNSLKFPLFVKPSHLGSSVGVTKVDKWEELEPAILIAFKLDNHILVEQGIVDPREIEFAVLGNSEVTAFHPGEVFTEGQFMKYHEKYGTTAFPNTPKASISKALSLEGRELAQKAYKAIGCIGTARVDFFLDKNEKYWFNELNPLPGCTPTSPYPLICEANGLSIKDLVNNLVILGLSRYRSQQKLGVTSTT